MKKQCNLHHAITVLQQRSGTRLSRLDVRRMDENLRGSAVHYRLRWRVILPVRPELTFNRHGDNLRGRISLWIMRQKPLLRRVPSHGGN